MTADTPRRSPIAAALLTLPVVLAVLMLAGCSSAEEGRLRVQLSELTVEEVETGLPKVVLTTPDGTDIVSRDEWMGGVKMTILMQDGSVSYDGTLQAKGRGNSTWGFPKKPYALKLDTKATILGMPRHKRWCLLANWLDRTLMRNAVAFEIARQMPGLEWTPRGEFVELFVNGRFQGNYYLCEQIKIDPNRVNIAEADDGSGDVTGGYIFEIDDHYDELFRFDSEQNLPWQFKVPDEVTPAQFDYGRQLVSEMEHSLYDAESFARRDFVQYMHLESFADWLLVQELTTNTDPQSPRSCFMYKDRDRDGRRTLMHAGPVWDFDYNSFVPELSNQYTVGRTLYYPQLMRDAGFRRLLRQRWDDLKSAGLAEHVCQYIDQTQELLTVSDQLNSVMWPINNSVNADNLLSFPAAVARLKQSFLRKYAWLDYTIGQLKTEE